MITYNFNPFFFLLQIPVIENPESINSVMSWGMGLFALVIVALATAIGRLQSIKDKELSELNTEIRRLEDERAREISALNSEMRTMQATMLDKSHDLSTSLKMAMAELSRMHPEYKEYLREISARILAEVERLTAKIEYLKKNE